MIINLIQLLAETIKQNSTKTALIVDHQRITYAEIWQASNAFAAYLVANSIARGDRIVICLDNSLEVVLAFWGALKANAVVSIIHPEQAIEKIVYILKDSSARILITSTASALKIQPFITSTMLYKVININNSTDFDFTKAMVNPIKKMLPKNSALDIDLAAIIYTSGSTGEPKGVMMSHHNMLAAIHSINSYLENCATDIILSVLPMSFDYGLYQMLMAFSVGATLVLEKNFLLPSQTLKVIQQEKVTALPCVPSMINLLASFNELTHYDLTSVRYVTNTGAAISEKQIELITALFPRAEFYSMYGLTECKRCTYLPPKDLKRKAGSVGVAIPNTEMWVVDHNNQRLGPNQVGQLVIRGSTIMQGYWNKPEKTQEKLKTGLLPNEKILFTGDYGLIDEEGYLYFKGRMDEIIKIRGMKVSPKEIEDIFIAIPDINEAAVIGMPSDNSEMSIYLCIATKSNYVNFKNQIYLICHERLAYYQRPEIIAVLSNLPKTNNGKIDKLKLKTKIEAKEVTIYKVGSM